MNEIIEWLMKMEKMAGDFYSDAALFFKEDERIHTFLLNAAQDEMIHFQIMESAKAQQDEVELEKPLISLSDEMKHKHETLFAVASKRIKEKTLSIEQMLDCIIETEFSEWNKIFRYVVNSFKQQLRHFYFSAARMQNHMGRTQHFVESFPHGAKRIGDLQMLERVFDENILVVEDNEILSEFMESILEEEGNVDVAFNGKDALEKLNGKYYRLIVSDIEMPVMNGIDFFHLAVKRFPSLKSRFMFVTGFTSKETTAFVADNQITLLPKPSSLDDITRNARRIIHSVVQGT